jgi:hypothetical protein
LSAQIKRINIRLAKIAENQKEYNIGHTPLAPVTSSTTATSAWYATHSSISPHFNYIFNYHWFFFLSKSMYNGVIRGGE